MIDFLARESHFFDHLAPVWLALPAEVRGRFRVEPGLLRRAKLAGIDATDEAPAGALTVVASYGDMRFARELGCSVVLSEHGAGQTYLGSTSGSYLGAPDRDSVVAVLVPGEMQAAKHRCAHPSIPAFVVGCPKLDRRHVAAPKPVGDPPVVAVSFHWNASRIAPEAQGAYGWYLPALDDLAKAFPGAIGHGHPKALDQISGAYLNRRMAIVEDFDEVMARADVYVCDNSSTLYEFASLDRPVVVLNTPQYRRNVEHGLRFWSHADVGVQVDRHQDLVAGVRRALEDPPVVAERRREIVGDVYSACDGKAGERAAAAVMEVAS